MKQSLNKAELRHIQLEILDDIHAFCLEGHMNYSLCGGTMLGAVRHSGYIPWDDDIDLMMPRSDYERFKKEYHSDRNEVVNLAILDSCSEQFIKVSRKGTYMEDRVMHRVLWGVNVDIFPVDGLPEDYRPYTGGLIDLHARILEGFKYYKAARRNRLYWTARYAAKKLLYRLPSDVLALKQQLEVAALAHLPQDMPLSTVIYGDFRIFPFPSQVFFSLENIGFEGKMYKCIKDTHLYLSTVYGDYMQLPPEEKRVSHHLYDVYTEG